MLDILNVIGERHRSLFRQWNISESMEGSRFLRVRKTLWAMYAAGWVCRQVPKGIIIIMIIMIVLHDVDRGWD